MQKEILSSNIEQNYKLYNTIYPSTKSVATASSKKSIEDSTIVILHTKAMLLLFKEMRPHVHALYKAKEEMKKVYEIDSYETKYKYFTETTPQTKEFLRLYESITEKMLNDLSHMKEIGNKDHFVTDMEEIEGCPITQSALVKAIAYEVVSDYKKSAINNITSRKINYIKQK